MLFNSEISFQTFNLAHFLQNLGKGTASSRSRLSPEILKSIRQLLFVISVHDNMSDRT